MLDEQMGNVTRLIAIIVASTTLETIVFCVRVCVCVCVCVWVCVCVCVCVCVVCVCG